MADATARPAAGRAADEPTGLRGLWRWIARPRGEYLLAVPDDARARLARGWLALALAAIIGAGVYSVLLVVSRTRGAWWRIGAMALALLALANPVFTQEDRDPLKSVVAVVL
ncbi:MAG: hypothetical protein KJ025_17635, partial [Burkholderiales bacterium]|nr:hypothetical protein [Burkholderiales bacterium]